MGLANKNEENYNKKGEVVGKIEKYVGDWKKLSQAEIDEEKVEFIENYFTQKTVRYNESSSKTFHKFVNVEYEPRTAESKRFIDSLWRRYSYRFDAKEDFMGEVMGAVTTAVYQFNESQDTYNYKLMNVEGSRENTRLHAYLVKRGRTGISPIESYIMQYTNFIDYKKLTGNGEIEELKVESYDEPVEIDGELMSLHELLGEDSDIFKGYVGNEYDSDEGITYKSNYHKPHFKVWFEQWLEEQKKLRANDNRHVRSQAKLTSHQLIYIDYMSKHYRGQLINNDEAYNVPEWIGAYNQYTRQQRNDFNNRIRKAVLKAYDEQFPNGMTFREMQNLDDIELLQEAIDIVNDDDSTAKQRNYRLSRWICGKTNERILDDIIVNRLDFEDSENIYKAKFSNSQNIDSKVLYRFVEQVENMLLTLKTADNSKVKFYKKEEEFIEGSRDKAITARKERDERYRQLRQSEVKVYKNGELVETIEYEDQPKRKQIKQKRLLPNGVWTEIDVNSDENF